MAHSKVEADSKLKSSNRQLSGASKKLKFHADHQESLRDMRSQLCEAELQLKLEQAARRRAEERHVFTVTPMHPCTHAPMHPITCLCEQGAEKPKVLPRARGEHVCTTHTE